MRLFVGHFSALVTSAVPVRVCCLVWCLWLASCSSNAATRSHNIERVGGFKVEVSSGGRTVDTSAGSGGLIQHIDLKEEDLDELTAGGGDFSFSKLPLVPLLDRTGESMGLETQPSNLQDISTRIFFQKFGLRQGDILMAVDRTNLKKTEDLGNLVDNLYKAGEATLTFKRQSMPHKSFYRLLPAGIK